MRNTDDLILGAVCFVVGLIIGTLIEKYKNED